MEQQTQNTAPKMIAFHGDPKIKAKYLRRVRAHQKADAIWQGWGYVRDGKFCAVGCTLHSNQHSAYETELGIPEQLAHLEDALFEGMPVGRSKTWPGEFLAAIKPGADLSKVTARFVVWAGIDPKHGIVNLAQADAERVTVKKVCALYQRIIDGGTVTHDEWLDIEIRAGAGAGAWAWAWAWARYEQQADKLLELLREAE
jgi:hypothetical protein